tara:strand:- start:260 stop:553 length:294 start_codon:yes stop_codon:yes gene_type:complete
MKTKFNNFFAFVGFVTCFILACSASVEIMDDLDEMQTSNVDVTLKNDYGKYQIINYINSNGNAAIMALNTETGNAKYYYKQDNTWIEDAKYNITFTH